MIKRFNINRNKIHIISLSCNTVPPVKYGGIELIVGNLCKGLSNLGAKVVCYSPGVLNVDNVEHVKTLDAPSLSIKDGGRPNTVEHLEKIASELRKNTRYGDVVLFNHADQFRYLKKRLGYFTLARLSLFEIAHWMDAGIYKNVIYPSSSLKDTIKKPGFYIPHGIDLKFSSNTVANKSPNLFFAGRLTEDKGLTIALEACKKIGCKLVLAGPMSQVGYSDALVRDDRVDYLGELDYEALIYHYSINKAQVYLTQYNEPFGLSVIEAMAAGSPVITTGLGGTGETVINGKTGFFCNSVEDVIIAYHKLDTINVDDCIKQASKYTVNAMAEAYLDLFLAKNLNQMRLR